MADPIPVAPRKAPTRFRGAWRQRSIVAALGALALTISVSLPARAMIETPTSSASSASSASAGSGAPVGQIVVPVVADSYSNPAAPTRVAGQGLNVMVGDAGTDGRTGYLEFALPAAVQGATPAFASLVLHQDGPPRTGSVVVSTGSSSWTESTLDAANAPGPATPLSEGAVAPTGDPTVISIPPTAVSGQATVTLVLQAHTTAGTALAFASRENPDPTAGETLVLSYPGSTTSPTPQPTSTSGQPSPSPSSSITTGPPGPSGQRVVPVSADTYSIPSQPTQAPGQASVVMVGDESTDGRVGYLSFALPSDLQTATPSFLSLVLYQVGPTRAGAVVVHATTAGWDENTLDAANAPALLTAFSEGAVSPSGSPTVIALPPSATEGSSTVAFALTAQTTPDTAIAFASAQNSDQSLQAELVFSYPASGPSPTPTPTGTGTSGSPSPSPTPTSTSPGCAESALLVPACGALIGSTANLEGVETSVAQSVARQESELGRTLDIVHVYHSGGDSWPTNGEAALASDPSHPRILFVSWKPENGSTWAQVAAGVQDGQIDATASRITSQLDGLPFFLTIHHEPENELGGTGSGYSPADYAAMFRHVVQRLRADGVTGMVTVWDMMGFDGWGDRGLYPQLYPGDDVVDWIGFDPYSHNGSSLAQIVDTHNAPQFPGFYTWATTQHPGKPLMLGEFGVAGGSSAIRASVFTSLVTDAAALPALKALVYFNHGPSDANSGGHDLSYDDDPVVLAAARMAFEDPYFMHSG